MLAMGFGISFDIENLAMAPFDQDDYAARPRAAPRLRGIALFLVATAGEIRRGNGAAFKERKYPDRGGGAPGFGRDLLNGRQPEVDATVDEQRRPSAARPQRITSTAS